MKHSGYRVEARGIVKSYGNANGVSVLKNLDLAIAPGETIAVVGASGTGKTTLLQILGTLDRPNAGTLLYEGTDVLLKSDTELSHFRNKTVGFVFQFHHLLPEFTALENVMMPGMIGGRKHQELMDDANTLLARVALEHRSHHKVGELSGGEQQRVALARALIMKPALLLADEPTGNLDPKTGLKVFDLLRQLNQDLSISTVMATHNYDLARMMDRCMTMAEGRLHDGLELPQLP